MGEELSTSRTPLSPVEAFDQTLKELFQKMLPHLGETQTSPQKWPFRYVSLYTQSRAFAAPACQGTGQGHAIGSI